MRHVLIPSSYDNKIKYKTQLINITLQLYFFVCVTIGENDRSERCFVSDSVALVMPPKVEGMDPMDFIMKRTMTSFPLCKGSKFEKGWAAEESMVRNCSFS